MGKQNLNPVPTYIASSIKLNQCPLISKPVSPPNCNVLHFYTNNLKIKQIKIQRRSQLKKNCSYTFCLNIYGITLYQDSKLLKVRNI